MPQRKAKVERLAAFSDGVFAVIITIMVLDLKPPEQPTFAALMPLWPTALSYIVSYVFIAIVWLNHHHLLRFAEYPTPHLIWINFAHLFMVSLVPAATVWVASTRLAPVPVFVYAAVSVLVEVAYLQFEHHALSQAVLEEISHRTRRLAKLRSRLAFGLFVWPLSDSDVSVAQVAVLGFWVGVLCGPALFAARAPDTSEGGRGRS